MNKDSKILNPSFNKKYPIITHAKGIYMYDKRGNAYIDASSGPILCSLGHGLEEIADTLSDQAKKIAFAYRFECVTEVLEEACEKICAATNNDMTKVFMVNGGSEATEIAIKLSRRYHIDKGNESKYKVISRWQSYHGNTMGVLSVTGHTKRRAGYEPYLKEFGHIPPAYCYRCWYNQSPQVCQLECANALENEILCQGPETVAAFIAEPISGMSLCGARPREDYFKRIREICDKYDVLLILDEIMTGIGRTGKNFAYQHFGIVPDIITLGKALCGGYFPTAAVACTDKIYNVINEKSANFIAGYSWAGNPLGCAVALKTLDYIEKHNLIENAAEKGEYLKEKLKILYKHPTVGDIRGSGLMVGIEFVKDKGTKEPFDPSVGYSGQISQEALKQKMFFEVGTGNDKGQRGDMAMIAPAFIVTKEQIDNIVEILDKVITEVEKMNGFEK